MESSAPARPIWARSNSHSRKAPHSPTPMNSSTPASTRTSANVWRANDLHVGDKVNDYAFQALVRAAVAHNASSII
jgi:hypothetical protein